MLPVLPPFIYSEYTVIGYADDIKPGVSSMNEFNIINHAASLFERSSGCLLHQDPVAGKCRVLALGRWRNVLQQEDIGHPYLKLHDSLSMLGVELTASWQSTRKINCSIALRQGDIQDMTSKCKSWCYQDLLLKPSEVTLFREVQQGGLGLYHIQSRAMANLITTFLQTAANARFNQSLMHSHLYRYHVLEEHHLPCPGYTPYYGEQFFDIIKKVKNSTPLKPMYMNQKDWYKFLLEENMTMRDIDDEGRKEQSRDQ